VSAEIIQFPVLNENRANIERRIRDALDAHGPKVCGFALVVWGEDGRSTADLGTHTPESGMVIPEILVPDFVRNRLLACKIEDWTLDSVRGYQAPPEDPA
jgi:hypothetical protein